MSHSTAGRPSPKTTFTLSMTSFRSGVLSVTQFSFEGISKSIGCLLGSENSTSIPSVEAPMHTAVAPSDGGANNGIPSFSRGRGHASGEPAGAEGDIALTLPPKASCRVNREAGSLAEAGVTETATASAIQNGK